MTIETSQPNVRKAVPFLWVRDIQASRRFYVEGLGFSATQQWIDGDRLRWCWLELGGAAIMLQERSGALGDEQGATAHPNGGMAIYFICDDALAIYRGLRARGVSAGRPFVGNAMWVTELTDPDGYRLAFESPTDAPEESVFTD